MTLMVYIVGLLIFTYSFYWLIQIAKIGTILNIIGFILSIALLILAIVLAPLLGEGLAALT